MPYFGGTFPDIKHCKREMGVSENRAYPPLDIFEWGMMGMCYHDPVDLR